MHKEDEAKQLWCPFTRVIGIYHSPDFNRETLASGNRFGSPWGAVPFEFQEASRCIASQCAAWRWVDPSNPYPEDRAQHGGYCGLVGKP